MAVNRKDIESLGHLARIELADEELTRLTPEIKGILGYVEQLKQLDVENVPPTAGTLDLTDVLRPDTPASSLPPEEALRNAPDRDGPYFRVPRIIDPTE